MPVYAYKCRDCGAPLEVHQEFSDAPLTECPTCGGVLRKQYGSIGVTFNGSGFYRTDSRAGQNGAGPKGAPEKGAGEKGAAEKGAVTKSGASDSPAAAPAKAEGAQKPAKSSPKPAPAAAS